MSSDLATEMYRQRADAVVSERGEGPPVLCAHGTLMDRTMFRPQLDALSDEHRVAAYDLRARTEHWAGPYDLDDLVEDCLAVTEGLDMESPVLVGMSMGGFMGLRLALDRPEALSGLVLVDAMPEPHSEGEREQYGGMVEPLADADAVPEQLAESVAHFLFGPTTMDRRPDLVASWVERWKTYQPEAVYHEVHSWLNRDGVVARLDDLDVPTLVVHGEEDQSIDPERAEPVADAAPDGRFVPIPEAGHSSNLENPEAVNEALREFLADVY